MMYIHSICSINALGMIDTHSPIPDLDNCPPSLDAQEPAYAQWIPPMQLRRMSKGLRMGLTAAKSAINDAGVTAADLSAITVGTAYGMLKDSESFLGNMVRQNESMLNPTAFIQSTHNTIAGAIALSIQCNVHNMTFVHKAQSFESALLDAELKLLQYPQLKIVIGGVDEKNDTLEWLLKGLRKDIQVGEGASFMVAGNTPDKSIAALKAYTQFKTNNKSVAAGKIQTIIQQYAHQPFLLVKNYSETITLENTPEQVDVHEVIGYNPTGSSMALVLGIKYLQQLKVPVIVVNSCRAFWSVFELLPVTG
ncbi:3-oxoacyl-(acyl carrier protein) synthase II [compost metagenome]